MPYLTFMTNPSKHSRLIFLLRPLLLFVFFYILPAPSVYPAAPPKFQALKKCLFVTPLRLANLSKAELNDFKSLRNSVFVSGINFDEIPSDSLSSSALGGYDLLIVPVASANELSLKQLSMMKDALKSGINLFFDGVSRLNDELGITLSAKPQMVSRIRCLLFPDIPLYWTDSAYIKTINTAGIPCKILCVADSTQNPICISRSVGKGKFVYFSTYFDPITPKGYSRFPFLIETLKAEFDIKVLAERRAMEMYFDPGMRDTVPIGKLVELWRKNKIKRIHAGGWYYDEDYDYAKLIRSCHANGILVYCWFEAPMISRTFWDKHPEWREKTVYNKDAAIDWRLLMNLANPDCRKQIFKEWSTFLTKNDFDGVNFAELYFEPSPVGPNLPENFTPMNLQVRNQFKKQAGFDPVELFDTTGSHYWQHHPTDWRTYADYRKNLLLQLKQHFLGFLTQIQKQKKDYEIMLTVLDVSLTPELSDFIGEDTRNTLKLYKQFGLTMQIEDPSNCWGLTPERYEKMGIKYRQYIKAPNKLLFDCNVVGSHEKGEGGFPAEKPTGEEIRQITFNMLTNIGRPVFYSEDAINMNDWENISQTLAGDTKIKMIQPDTWIISAKNTVIIHTGIPDARLELDGQPWYAVEGDAVIIPRGIHKLALDTGPSSKNTNRILAVSGELLSADFRQNGIAFSYSEDIVSCYVTIDRQPLSILVDGHRLNCEVLKNAASAFTLKLPAGTHKVFLNF